jgi:pyruvate dehydrogenase E1 component
VPGLDALGSLLESSGDREMSTTMAFVRLLTLLARDKKFGRHVVPIVPDEARTFGMEGLFRQLGIYSSVGQLYEPQDREQVMYYKEDKKGQILEEGINEAGAMSSWIAAATSYSTHGVATVPFYIYYSMFGFQRVGDLIWAAGDMQARGFLIGGTAGRTTLAGEGLQHQDGHSLMMAANVPNCISYDPTFAYELAVIVHSGLQRMFVEQQKVFYYITTMNENYPQPAMPKGAEKGIVRGLYKFAAAGRRKKQVRLLGSGTILREVIAAAALLDQDFGVSSEVWSATSFNELARDGRACDREALLKPKAKPPVPWVTQCLSGSNAPVIAATDYVKAYADQIRAWVPAPYRVLGTDGFGRSDTRAALRRHFEVDRHYVVVAALKSLSETGEVEASVVADAIARYGIDTSRPDPLQA